MVCSGMITVTPRMGKQMETKSRSMSTFIKMQLEVEVFVARVQSFGGKILQLPNQQSYTKFGFFKNGPISRGAATVSDPSGPWPLHDLYR